MEWTEAGQTNKSMLAGQRKIGRSEYQPLEPWGRMGYIRWTRRLLRVTRHTVQRGVTFQKI